MTGRMKGLLACDEKRSDAELYSVVCIYTVIIDIYLYTYMNIHEIEDFLVCLVLERVVF